MLCRPASSITRYRPGTVMGGNDLEHDCGTSRSIGYFLEPLIVLGLFGQKRLTITLKGITNDSKDPSVDTFRTTTLPLLKKFGIPSQHVDLKIESRGVPPLGGGKVVLSISPFVHDTLKAITWIDEGLVESVRGFTFSARVPGKFEHKILQAAHKIFDPLLRNVHINTDHKTGTQAGKSPSYGISLVATTTTGCCYSADTAVYHGRADEVDDLDDETKDSSLTDDDGEQIALALLNEIKQGGVVDSRHQVHIELLRRGYILYEILQSSQNEIPMKDSGHKPMAAKSSNLDEELYRKGVVSDSGVEVRVGQDDNKKHYSDDTVVARFVDTAIVGKSSTEDARHHGLVEPTVNTKEAMNAINSMFREPIEPSISGRTSRKQSSIGSNKENGFSVFADDTSESQQNSSEVDNNHPLGESFEIYVDGEETDDVEEIVNGKGTPVQDTDTVEISSNHATVFARPNDHSSECFKDPNPRRHGFREDTAVYRFVGTTISDEPEVENVWHHGLVDPTVNLKEAMNDINSMFGKPIEFTRKRRPKKYEESPDVKDHGQGFLILPDDEPDDNQKPLNMSSKYNLESRDKLSDEMNNHSGFLILPDDDLDNQQESSLPSSSTKKDSDLFEQTVCTKEAMAEINKLFAMPMDF